jgi:hypothetical protein
MAKDALIKLRCASDLNRRITELAERRGQSVSDYIRTRLLDTTPELSSYPEPARADHAPSTAEAAAGQIAAQSASLAKAALAPKTPRGRRRSRKATNGPSKV